MSLCSRHHDLSDTQSTFIYNPMTMKKTISFLAMLTLAFAGWVLLTSNTWTQAYGWEGNGTDEAREAARAQVEATIEANDFDAFVAQREAMKAEKEATREAKIAEKLATATEEEKANIEARIAKRAEKKASRTEKTSEELQAKFDEMVAYYNENGELPSRKGKRGFGKRWGHSK